jgi:hypothetical protein
MARQRAEAEQKWEHVSRIAKRLAMSDQGVHNLIAAGHLEAIRLPGTGRKPIVRVSLASVERLEQRSRQG